MAGINLYAALQSGHWSDLEIKCKGRNWKVHRLVVCTQSEFFAAALRHPFKEALSGFVEFPEDSPEDIDRMLTFLYTGSVDFPAEHAQEEEDNTGASPGSLQTPARLAPHPVFCILRMYFLADKLVVPSLMQYAALSFGPAIIDLPLGHPDFPSILQVIYSHMPNKSAHEMLRWWVTDKTVRLLDCAAEEQRLRRTEVENALEAMPYLALDVIAYQTREKRRLVAEYNKLKQEALQHQALTYSSNSLGLV